jgi:hypothetical protein
MDGLREIARRGAREAERGAIAEVLARVGGNRAEASPAATKRSDDCSFPYSMARAAVRSSFRWTALTTVSPATIAGSVDEGGVRPAA